MTADATRQTYQLGQPVSLQDFRQAQVALEHDLLHEPSLVQKTEAYVLFSAITKCEWPDGRFLTLGPADSDAAVKGSIAWSAQNCAKAISYLNSAFAFTCARLQYGLTFRCERTESRTTWQLEWRRPRVHGGERSRQSQRKLLRTWHKTWDYLLQPSKWPRGENRSESIFVTHVLDAVTEMLDALGGLPDVACRQVTDLLDRLVESNPNYPVLGRFYAAFRLASNRSEQDRAPAVRELIASFKESRDSRQNSIALYGSSVIVSGDSILLYSGSRTIARVIAHWSHQNPGGRLTLLVCECHVKSYCEGMNQPFHDAIAMALMIKDAVDADDVRIHLVRDVDVAALLKNKHVTKVFLGVTHLQRVSAGPVVFRNTSGSFGIAQLAHHFDIPIFAFSDKEKEMASEIRSVDSAPVSRPKADPFIRPDIPGFDQNGSFQRLRQKDPDVGVLALPYPESISSEDVPFVLVTEDGIRYCTDFDLRKSNRVLPDHEPGWIMKRLTQELLATAERNALSFLGRAGSKRVPPFSVPGVDLLVPPEWSSVRMKLVRGVRTHDLIATMRKSTAMCRAAADLSDRFVKWALEDVAWWQSDSTQRDLQSAIEIPVGAYDFHRKFSESLAYTARCARGKDLTHDMVQAIQDEGMTHVCDCLVRDAVVVFRDATLKNQLVQLDQLGLNSIIAGTAYSTDADHQWYDLAFIERLLGDMTDGSGELIEQRAESLRDHIVHVDFEACGFLTTREDDVFHVIGLEALGHNYDEVRSLIEGHLDMAGTVRETILFRAFRGWARRLAYWIECRDCFRTRYRHECLDHYYSLAVGAMEDLEEVHGFSFRTLRSLMEDGRGRALGV